MARRFLTMRWLLLFLGIVASAAVTSSENVLDIAWTQFMTVHSKQYSNQSEHDFRRGLFASNHRLIEEHNARYTNGQETYSLEMNHLGDLTDDEFQSMLLGFVPSDEMDELADDPFEPSGKNDSDIPKSIDWREKKAVTEVRNQGHCGSCWAFASIGAVESHTFLKGGKLLDLSEQNLVDCSKRDHGCRGGFLGTAFDYIRKHGVDTEESYPYEGKDGQCRFKPESVGANITGYVRIKREDENDLTKALAKVGPVAIAMNALGKFKFYKEGIYNPDKCSARHLNHAMLAVGYGEEKGTMYYIVKNSWSERWGDKGYVKMARNANNKCGIASASSYPKVAGGKRS